MICDPSIIYISQDNRTTMPACRWPGARRLCRSRRRGEGGAGSGWPGRGEQSEIQI